MDEHWNDEVEVMSKDKAKKLARTAFREEALWTLTHKKVTTTETYRKELNEDVDRKMKYPRFGFAKP